ncbi:unnamed protein product [Plutella xylostella]|uniref:(diamondback moth) hypothetical protein n=1 Tax=Plutella xylostella TaxID=51655 RepID=A0A8S4DZC3_PLUXY|nr:unnamed protein product [Plutella xylostella]
MEFIELILINKLDGVILKYPRHENIDGTLLHKNIDCIEKKENKPINGVLQGGSLFLKCKDLRIFQLDISSNTELNLLAQTLENLSRVDDPRLFYPFFYRHMQPIMENGYTLYSLEGEFTKVLASEDWRASRVNQRFTVCPSYGKVVIVPKVIDDDTLAVAATFRQGGRFPVLSYRHNNGAVLMRAGQPLYGPKHRRCRQDENILNSIVGVGMKGVIYDLRSSSAIAQQQNKGGGTESTSNYSQWKIYNRSMDEVDNQEQLLSSFSKLIEACNDRDISSDKWVSLSRLKAEPVLIHGTKGQDATLLICSLVQIILNPDCRTIRGLQALIEREWLQAGHPFTSRAAAGAYCSYPQAAPAFPLLLDCIRQFLEQFPCSFEYRQCYLIDLFEHSYASQYDKVTNRAAPAFPLLLDCIRQFLEQFPCSFEYRQCYLIDLFEHSYASQYVNKVTNRAAPAFPLLLDCIRQFLEQFPCSFEYRQCYLIDLLEHSYASQYVDKVTNSAAPAFPLLLDCIRQFLEQFPCSFEYRQCYLIDLFEHSYASQYDKVTNKAAPAFPLLLDCIRQFLEQFPCSFEYRQCYLIDLFEHSYASQQFLEQFPCSFEYRQCYLIDLFEHSYASQYGTFLGDCEQERESLSVYTASTSLWSWLNQPAELQQYLNPLYEPSPHVIWPSVAPMTYVIWEELYLRWLVEQHTEEIEEQYRRIRSKEQELRGQALQLRRELTELATQYYQPDQRKDKTFNKFVTVQVLSDIAQYFLRISNHHDQTGTSLGVQSQKSL